jgi:hypothetical protein
VDDETLVTVPEPPYELVQQLHAWALSNNLVVDLHVARYPNPNQPRRATGSAVARTDYGDRPPGPKTISKEERDQLRQLLVRHLKHLSAEEQEPT